MRDVEHCAGIFQELKRIGVRTVIDDFGSGYSSLLRLKKLPIHALKIDRFFVHDIATDPRNAAIVRAIVNLAHSVGIRVVAEGVETAEQLDLLRNLDWDLSTKPLCDRVQGFLLSRPLPPEGATTFLRDTMARRSMLKEHASTRAG